MGITVTDEAVAVLDAIAAKCEGREPRPDTEDPIVVNLGIRSISEDTVDEITLLLEERE